MISHKANFDYESDLFENKKNEKINQSFEHLYFFFNEEKPLYTTRKYSKEYIDYLENQLERKISFCDSGEFINWWGDLFDREVEKKLNSKLTSYRIAKKLNLLQNDSNLVYSIEELENIIQDNRTYYLRHPLERSGRKSFLMNHQFFLENNLKNKIGGFLNKTPLLIDEYRKSRFLDIGTTFKEDDGRFEISFQVENLNNREGNFKGGVLLKEKNKNLNEEILLKIADDYYKEGARKRLQIDSYLFKDKNDLKKEYLCEVNYRKTMGSLIFSLKDLCHKKNEVCVLCISNKKLKKFSSFKEVKEALGSSLFSKNEGIMPMSPIENPFSFWLFSFPSREDLFLGINEFWKKMAQEKEKLPEEYKLIK